MVERQHPALPSATRGTRTDSRAGSKAVTVKHHCMGELMCDGHRFSGTPIPDKVIVHERQSPSGAFGFRQGSGVEWQPAEPERRVRDEATVEWMQRIREDGR